MRRFNPLLNPPVEVAEVVSPAFCFCPPGSLSPVDPKTEDDRRPRFPPPLPGQMFSFGREPVAALRWPPANFQRPSGTTRSQAGLDDFHHAPSKWLKWSLRPFAFASGSLSPVDPKTEDDRRPRFPPPLPGQMFSFGREPVAALRWPPANFQRPSGTTRSQAGLDDFHHAPSKWLKWSLRPFAFAPPVP